MNIKLYTLKSVKFRPWQSMNVCNHSMGFEVQSKPFVKHYTITADSRLFYVITRSAIYRVFATVQIPYFLPIKKYA